MEREGKIAESEARMEERRKLFGTNGVRGVVNEFLTPEFVLQMGRAIGTVMRGSVAVATDTRTSNIMLKNALVSGLLSTGDDVVDFGIIPTPALQYQVKEGTFASGAVITASHNPPQFNGVKLISADGTEASGEEERSVEEAYYSRKYTTAGWAALGVCTVNHTGGTDYVKAVSRHVDMEAIRRRRFKVVLDCSNGAASLTSPYLMERLGVRAITMNAQPQGSFPGHESEPTPENLETLTETVKALGADMGIAHDGDADRTVFVDEKGRYIPGEMSLALMAREAVRNRTGATVVVPVSTPSVVEEAARPFGATTIYTRVGSPVVARKMMETGAVIGGEENGGIINPAMQYCRDGGMTAARMLEIVAEGGNLSDLIDSLPRVYTVKMKVSLQGRDSSSILERIDSETEGRRKDRTDGLKIFLEDGWVLIRPSGTEPLMRIFAEAKEAVRARKIAEDFAKRVEQ